MIYKVNVVDKPNLSEIRYVLSSDKISNAINKISQIDAIRDIANLIMSMQNNIDYVVATNMAKEMVSKEQQITSNKEFEQPKQKLLMKD